MSMSKKLELGQWVTIKGVLTKFRLGEDGDVVTWQRETVDPRPAMFVGSRRVFNGYWRYGESVEQGYHKEFCHSGTVQAYLFVFNDRSKPVYVSPEDVEMAS